MRHRNTVKQVLLAVGLLALAVAVSLAGAGFRSGNAGLRSLAYGYAVLALVALGIRQAMLVWHSLERRRHRRETGERVADEGSKSK